MSEMVKQGFKSAHYDTRIPLKYTYKPPSRSPVRTLALVHKREKEEWGTCGRVAKRSGGLVLKIWLRGQKRSGGLVKEERGTYHDL
jgi:hypothetical protein